MAKKPTKTVYNDDEDDLERCRRVRREIDAQFKSFDEMFEFMQKLDRAHFARLRREKLRKTRAEKKKRKITKG